MDEGTIRKNILDLQFQKYLIIASTSIIIAFTYSVGVVLAIATKQLELSDFVVMSGLAVVSTAVIGVCAAYFINSVFHLKNIPDVLKEITTE